MQVSRWYVDQSAEKLWKKRHVHAILEITWNAHESLEVKVLESHGQTKQWWQWPTVREECSFQLRPPVKLWYEYCFLHAASSKVAKRIQNLSESFLRIGKSYWQSLILPDMANRRCCNRHGSQFLAFSSTLIKTLLTTLGFEAPQIV